MNSQRTTGENGQGCPVAADGTPGQQPGQSVDSTEREPQFGALNSADIPHLSRLAARLAAIVESSEDAIIAKDVRGNITSWNRGAEKIFGYTASEMIGGTTHRLLLPGMEDEDQDVADRVRSGETVVHLDTKRRRQDGTIIHVALTFSPIKDNAGRTVGVSKVGRDITEKLQMERALHQSQKLEAIGQLTGGVAHDFNNLLGVILGNLELLERQLSGNEPALRRVHTAKKAAARGADLTRRLLAFSSTDELCPTCTGLNDAILNIIEMASRGIGPEIRITTDLDSSIPPIFADSSALENALLNLVVNSRDAMPNGGTLGFTTRLRRPGDDSGPMDPANPNSGWYACVSVSDTGSGMSKETAERAFEPFFTTKARDKGTGLGLAMVYGFVKQSGGNIRIESDSGVGTTVTFHLPIPLAAAPSFEPPQMPSLPEIRNGCVLVVDDEPELLEIAMAYVEELGCTALRACDAESALQIIENHREVDLIVTDIIMPGGINGIELAERARHLRPGIEIVYCSGFPTDALSLRAKPEVDRPLLRKPYRESEFDAVVRHALERAFAKRQIPG